MEFNHWISDLRKKLENPLPGLDAQLKMSGIRRFRELATPFQPALEIPSSVLILFYPVINEPYLVLIQRPVYDGVHAGQIGLPGGRKEEYDQNLQATALRESEEEVGINPGSVLILGNLTPLYIPPSQFLVTPYIGYTTERPQFRKDPVEVDEIIELPVKAIFQEGTIQIRKHKVIRKGSIKAPAYVVNGRIIWGATAMILSELHEIIDPGGREKQVV